MMSSDAGGPAVAPTLREWLKAREETLRHITAAPAEPDATWTQHLADLLTTERSWQDQYTELLGTDSRDGRFPPSKR